MIVIFGGLDLVSGRFFRSLFGFRFVALRVSGGVAEVGLEGRRQGGDALACSVVFVLTLALAFAFLRGFKAVGGVDASARAAVFLGVAAAGA